jgi:hypothetical protein
MTDAQILEVLRNSAGGCGRFRIDQVNRDLVTPLADSKFSFKSFYKLAASLLLLLSAGKATAQEKKDVPIQEAVSNTLKQVYKRITGLVTDSEGEPLTGATIQLEGQAISLVAGIDGEFEMHIPNSAFAAGTVSFTFSYVGYRSESIIFSTGDFPLALKVKMQRPSESKTHSGNFEIIPPSETTKQDIAVKEIEKMTVRDIASQVATTSGFLQQRGGNDLIIMSGASASSTTYIIDGVLQIGKPRKWWQFWKRH